MQSRQLGKAPITEAVIELKCEFEQPPSLAVLEGLHGSISAAFPDKQHRIAVNVHVNSEQSTIQTIPDAVHQDIVMWAGDKKSALQVKHDGLAFSLLFPYTTWPELIAIGKTYLPQYIAATRPSRVVALIARFINRIELPDPPGPLSDWFNFYPTTPENRAVDSFVLRTALRLDPTTNGVMTLVSEQAVADKRPIILDIQLARNEPFSPTDELLWERLEGMRELKNRLFFDAITERAGGLFE